MRRKFDDVQKKQFRQPLSKATPSQSAVYKPIAELEMRRDPMRCNEAALNRITDAFQRVHQNLSEKQVQLVRWKLSEIISDLNKKFSAETTGEHPKGISLSSADPPTRIANIRSRRTA